MAKSKSCLRQRAGFTLIELLVAISVLAVVAVLGWRGLDGIVRARLALNGQLAETRGMQLAFAQLQSDCAHIAGTTLIPDRVALVADGDRLLLVRSVYADDQPTRVQVVAYRLHGGVLTRQESAATRNLQELDALWQAMMADKGTLPAIELQPNVATMVFRTWAAGQTGWQSSGSDASGSFSGAKAPMLTGLEVSLQLRGQQTSMVKVFLLGAV